jgi:thiol-disulfide isomerase/thioredoxin/mono/diheme cytochrome c family protein
MRSQQVRLVNCRMAFLLACGAMMTIVLCANAKEGASGHGATAAIAATGVAQPHIGDQLGPLTFTDIRFLPRSLSDLASKQDPVPKRAFVLIFTNTTCPLVQRYFPRLKALDQEFRDRGVQFVAVNVGPQDSVFDMATQAVKFDVPFPFVKDVDGSCVAACGVERTPAAVVIDADHRLRYRGRIDNNYRLGGTSPAAVTSELRDAIAALLAGDQIAVAETPVDGCLITKSAAAKPSEAYTYTEHIAPLVKQHCQACHRPGTAAPFSLLRFDDVAANAEMIAEVIQQQRMPPWYASPDHGQFTNARTLPAADRAMLVDWVRSGTPRGDGPDESPAPVVKAAGDDADPWAGLDWQMGEPDLILEVPFTYDVPADGYVDYKYAMLPRVFLHDTWLEAVEIQPSNPRVVHHANLGHLPIGRTGAYSKLITGYVPGVGPMLLKPGVAAKIPAGSALAMQIHITTTGKPETVKLRVGFRYPRDKVEKELHYYQLNNVEFAIPPYAAHHPVSRDETLADDVTLVGFFAHMHVRGKDMTFRAFPPQGDPVTLLMIPNYNFDWQLPYHLPPGQVRFPAGTRLECLAHFDNSTFNPYNPDPSATVHDGQQTFQEMMYGFVFYTKDAEQLGLEIDTSTGSAK